MRITKANYKTATPRELIDAETAGELMSTGIELVADVIRSLVSGGLFNRGKRIAALEDIVVKLAKANQAQDEEIQALKKAAGL